MAEITDFWQWWVIALVLLMMEVFVPGAIFLWMGISAGVMGLVLFAIPDMNFSLQMMLFGVMSLVSIIGWQVWFKKDERDDEGPQLNRRGSQYIDRTIVLEEAIVHGKGHVILDDTRWQVRGDDCAQGTPVKVVDIDGSTLVVIIDED